MRALVEKESSQYGDADEKTKQIDFILYIGDDGQAEQVFKYLNRIQTKQQRLIKKQLHMQNNPQAAEIFEKLKQSNKSNVSPDINVYTCTLGRRATQAKYYLSDSYQIVNMLEQINEVQEKINDGSIDKMKKVAGRRQYSLANFGTGNFRAFGKLTDFINDKDQVVKTRAGGEFTRQSGKNKLFKFGLVSKSKNSPDEQAAAAKKSSLLRKSINSKIDDAPSSKLKRGKRGGALADMIANKVGGSDSDEKRSVDAVGESDVNFVSDNDNFQD